MNTTPIPWDVFWANWQQGVVVFCTYVGAIVLTLSIVYGAFLIFKKESGNFHDF